ncbi:histidine phosphatase family protein [Phaeobacter gallaeciensis]|uniref:Histidine phosphatase family protein n=2 Tax=Roseobacteraceae TaxID=2854170 RepID=A0A366WLR9_9RHOB|nr:MULTISPECIES: histidine phosphatase family protein [Roseobacteraceae]MBT3141669.1 histidine phosphatase family protein [Falsiruegeria litorea]MBT8170154.1 histidine phosphatase family protein [Falsiruegeria litorea]RBW50774.1 histidine phosphatase family protein [Phaeobacter gallaeciensis]
MPRLALIRHGHTEWNRAGRIQGRSDIPLDDAARKELSEFALPAPWDSADLWASPLHRARETAEIIAGRAPKTAPELTEMNWGDWEGLRGVDLVEQPDSGFRHIEDWGWDYRPLNGESPAEVWYRIEPWVKGITTDTIAVCHIGIMRMILAKAYGWDFSGPAPFRIKRNRLFVVDLPDMRPWPDPVRLIKRASLA